MIARDAGDRSLEGKVAVVTGAAGGLGRAFAVGLARAGAAVALVDVDRDGLAAAAAEVSDEVPDRRTLEIECDVRFPDQVREAVAGTREGLGGPDVLVNNAGGSLHTPKALEKIEERHWDLVLDVNLKGAFLFSQAVVPIMRERGGGRIVNVSSIGGRTASIVTGSPYAASKAGLIGLTRRLAAEVGRWEINVNAVAPGTVLSGPRMVDLWEELDDEEQRRTLETIPLGRLSTAEEQAEVIVFLAGPASRYITGAVIDVNGGRFMG